MITKTGGFLIILKWLYYKNRFPLGQWFVDFKEEQRGVSQVSLQCPPSFSWGTDALPLLRNAFTALLVDNSGNIPHTPQPPQCTWIRFKSISRTTEVGNSDKSDLDSAPLGGLACHCWMCMSLNQVSKAQSSCYNQFLISCWVQINRCSEEKGWALIWVTISGDFVKYKRSRVGGF